MANLDPADTQFVELHGTGTKAGDGAEVRAVAGTIAEAAVAANRSTAPLYCGSVKSRVGHTEAAAGMAAIIKSVMCLEKAVITPNLNFETANHRLMLGSSNIVVPTSTIPWPDCEVRRASVNNFGFGGTNAHAIIDDAYNYLRLRDKLPTSTKALPTSSCWTIQPRVFVLSAPERAATARQRHAHADYVESRCADADTETKTRLLLAPSLAKTLGERRSVFQWRHAVAVSRIEDLASRWRDETIEPVKAAKSPNLAFVFTGQGAQWYAMGRDLASYSEFACSVRKSAACLAAIGCVWNAWEELMLPESETESKLKHAEYSQPLCLVLQIALVDLTAHWGIRPMAVVGHSSGEIAAAYAAGALSRATCLKIAYHRGLVSKLAQARRPGGCMMAVGLSAEAVEPYIARTGGVIVVACFNSPNNVTLAGDRAALEELKDALDRDAKFCRLLQVENAYHSSQMLSVSDDYREAIEGIFRLQQDASPSSVIFYSTVHGRQMPVSEIQTADYWVQNLCSPVRFVDALDSMLYADVATRQLKAKSEAPSLLFEIGPHSALAGPIKQYKEYRGSLQNLMYASMLIRAQSACLAAVSAAGKLWAAGVSVNLNKVSCGKYGEVDDLVKTSSSYWVTNRPLYRSTTWMTRLLSSQTCLRISGTTRHRTGTRAASLGTTATRSFPGTTSSARG